MARAKTYFEQVPVATAKQIAKQEARTFDAHPVACVICGEPVKLENCKIDEGGSAVHEECYVIKLAAPVPLTSPRSRPNP